jgi:HPt (histidine-containing phosphotransfer) domain-containing protein
MADPVIDTRTIDSLRELGQDLLDEVVAIFVNESAKRIADVERAAREGDPTAMWKAAHELRSVASNAGAMRLAHLCDVVQERGTGGSVEGMDGVVTNLRRERDAAADALQNLPGA